MFRPLRFVVAAVAVLFAAQISSAAVVTSWAGGSYGVSTSNAGGTLNFSDSGSSIQQLGGTLIPGNSGMPPNVANVIPQAGGFLLSDFSFTPAGSGDPTNGSISPATLSATVQAGTTVDNSIFGNPSAGGTVTWTLIDPPTPQGGNTLGGGYNVVFSGFLSGNNTGIDFGTENRIWSFLVTANGVTNNGGIFTIGGNATASLSAFATRDVQPGPGVPEPMTLATFGLISLVGGTVARRKMKAQVA